MSALSDYAEDELLDHLLGTGAFTMPANVYLALFTSNPADDASGTEVSGGAYARTAASFGAASSGQATNDAAVTFPAPSGANWGTITHFALFDASTSGNMLVYGALGTSIVVNDGDAAPSFAIGSLTVTAD